MRLESTFQKFRRCAFLMPAILLLPAAASFAQQSKEASPQRSADNMFSLPKTREALLIISNAVDSKGTTTADGENQDREFVEPIITEETMPNEVGEWDFRWSAVYLRGAHLRTGSLPGFHVFYGIANRLGGEVSIVAAFASEETRAYGVGDVSTSLKYLLVKPGGRMPVIVLGFEVSFPTGDTRKQLGDGAYELAPFVAMLKDFGPFTLQGNAGWSKQMSVSESDSDDTSSNRYFYNVALAVPVHSKKLHALLEANGSWSAVASEIAIAPGLRYRLTDKISLGFGVPFGLKGSTYRWGCVSQFQLGFNW